MSVAARLPLSRRVEAWLPGALTGALGVGAMLALAGAASRDVVTTAVGGGIALAALSGLVAAGWIDGLAVVAISLPFPALVSTESIRLVAAAPVTAAVVLGLALRWGKLGGPLLAGGMPWRSALLLGASALAATVFALHPGAAARELLNLWVLLAFLAAATDTIARDPRVVRPLVFLLVTTAAVCGVLGVLEAARIIPGEFPRGTFNRASLGFGQPNALGLFFAVVLPLAVHLAGSARSRAGRLLGGTAVALTVAGLVSTFSRGSWLAVLLGAGALTLARQGRFALRIWTWALLAAVAADLVTGGALRETVARTIGDWVIEQRLALMLAGVVMFLSRPWIGVGPGGYALELDHFGAGIPQLWDLQPTPHNAFVQMAAEAGVVGLLAFVAFMGAVLITLLRSAREAARTSDTAAAVREDRGIERAVLWSFSAALVASMAVQPFSHGPGQAVMLVAAIGLGLASRGDASL